MRSRGCCEQCYDKGVLTTMVSFYLKLGGRGWNNTGLPRIYVHFYTTSTSWLMSVDSSGGVCQTCPRPSRVKLRTQREYDSSQKWSSFRKCGQHTVQPSLVRHTFAANLRRSISQCRFILCARKICTGQTLFCFFFLSKCSVLNECDPQVLEKPQFRIYARSLLTNVHFRTDVGAIITLRRALLNVIQNAYRMAFLSRYSCRRNHAQRHHFH